MTPRGEADDADSKQRRQFGVTLLGHHRGRMRRVDDDAALSRRHLSLRRRPQRPSRRDRHAVRWGGPSAARYLLHTRLVNEMVVSAAPRASPAFAVQGAFAIRDVRRKGQGGCHVPGRPVVCGYAEITMRVPCARGPQTTHVRLEPLTTPEWETGTGSRRLYLTRIP